MTRVNERIRKSAALLLIAAVLGLSAAVVGWPMRLDLPGARQPAPMAMAKSLAVPPATFVPVALRAAPDAVPAPAIVRASPLAFGTLPVPEVVAAEADPLPSYPIQLASAPPLTRTEASAMVVPAIAHVTSVSAAFAGAGRHIAGSFKQVGSAIKSAFH